MDADIGDIAKYASTANLPVPPHEHDPHHTHDLPRFAVIRRQWHNIVNEHYVTVIAQLPDGQYFCYSATTGATHFPEDQLEFI